MTISTNDFNEWCIALDIIMCIFSLIHLPIASIINCHSVHYDAMKWNVISSDECQCISMTMAISSVIFITAWTAAFSLKCYALWWEYQLPDFSHASFWFESIERVIHDMIIAFRPIIALISITSESLCISLNLPDAHYYHRNHCNQLLVDAHLH